METNIDLEKAEELVYSLIKPVSAETVGLGSAYGRVLAQDLHSQLNIPPFARSPLDGYAYYARAQDSEPFSLRIVTEIPAGSWPERVLEVGEAARIFTGAPIPAGANCVVRMEDTEEHGDEVVIHYPVPAGANVVPEGDEIARGEVLLRQGVLLTPPALGLLAAAGVQEVPVYRRPKVGLLSTGSELIDIDSQPLPGKIYNSNSYTLRGLLQEAGCEVKAIPYVPDRLPETLLALEQLEGSDVVISTGGASVGEYDLMPQALEQHGCEMLFWKVNLKPGTPAAVGRKGNKLYFSLSGNPAAAVVTFELLVRPVLSKLRGSVQWQPQEFAVKMAGEFSKSGRQRRFLRATAVLKDGEIWADLAPAQGSGILRSMIGSDLLVDVPGGHGPVREGESLLARWIGK
ncbi:molybdopterin molybdotransferase MoeA [Paradesulfitobacterium aromaticivorans]